MSCVCCEGAGFTRFEWRSALSLDVLLTFVQSYLRTWLVRPSIGPLSRCPGSRFVLKSCEYTITRLKTFACPDGDCSKDYCRTKLRSVEGIAFGRLKKQTPNQPKNKNRCQFPWFTKHIKSFSILVSIEFRLGNSTLNENSHLFKGTWIYDESKMT